MCAVTSDTVVENSLQGIHRRPSTAYTCEPLECFAAVRHTGNSDSVCVCVWIRSSSSLGQETVDEVDCPDLCACAAAGVFFSTHRSFAECVK